MNKINRLVTLFVITILLLLADSTLSQSLHTLELVDEPEFLSDEIISKSDENRDVNGRLAAGILIVSELTGLKYDSNNGMVKNFIKRGPGEDLLYLSPDERTITVYCSGYQPLKLFLYEIGIKLKSGAVWRVEITGNKEKILKERIQKNFNKYNTILSEFEILLSAIKKLSFEQICTLWQEFLSLYKSDLPEIDSDNYLIQIAESHFNHWNRINKNFAEMKEITRNAYFYNRKPRALGGGQGSYIGWQIPEEMKKTILGEYKVKNLCDTSFILEGTVFYGFNSTKTGLMINLIFENQDVKEVILSNNSDYLGEIYPDVKMTLNKLVVELRQFLQKENTKIDEDKAYWNWEVPQQYQESKYGKYFYSFLENQSKVELKFYGFGFGIDNLTPSCVVTQLNIDSDEVKTSQLN